MNESEVLINEPSEKDEPAENHHRIVSMTMEGMEREAGFLSVEQKIYTIIFVKRVGMVNGG